MLPLRAFPDIRPAEQIGDSANILEAAVGIQRKTGWGFAVLWRDRYVTEL